MNQNNKQSKTSVGPPSPTPAKLVTLYSASEWEEFIGEWAEGFQPAYEQVSRIGGAGDMGRDVIGHLEPAHVRPRPCDIYQCKHYDHPLTPTDIYLELGKLCVHTYRLDYPVPRRYRFVPPRGIGPKLYNLMNDKRKLRDELVLNWEKYCQRSISENAEVPLVGALKDYVHQFDYATIWYLEPNEVLSQHQKTKYWSRRFQIDLLVRPGAPEVPTTIQNEELAYVTCLLAAYADHLKTAITVSDVPKLSGKIQANFINSRGNFFIADALNRFSRDHFPGGFDEVKSQVLNGVLDVTHGSHADGFACLLEVMKHATLLPLSDSELKPYVGAADKKGICHHLAGDGRLSWVVS